MILVSIRSQRRWLKKHSIWILPEVSSVSSGSFQPLRRREKTADRKYSSKYTMSDPTENWLTALLTELSVSKRSINGAEKKVDRWPKWNGQVKNYSAMRIQHRVIIFNHQKILSYFQFSRCMWSLVLSGKDRRQMWIFDQHPKLV